MFVDPLLWWHNIDELVEFPAKESAPSQIDVTIQTHGLVLRQHQHLADTAVQAVGQREIDNPVPTSKRNRGLGTITRQRFESRSFSTGQNHGQRI
jgi:hypothetical protein